MHFFKLKIHCNKKLYKINSDVHYIVYFYCIFKFEQFWFYKWEYIKIKIFLENINIIITINIYFNSIQAIKKYVAHLAKIVDDVHDWKLKVKCGNG